MIPEIQTKIKEYLPLVVEEVECDGPTLHFSGDNWSFSAISAWRIVQNNKFIFGSDDEENLKVSELIKNSIITHVEPQSSNFPVDPAFCFADGHRLEIFSDACFDTWTFRIPDEPLYDFTVNNKK